jgi:solute:Na+ symporter, SSS family
MMSNWLIFAICSYVLVQLLIAWVASRFIRTETDYLLAGRHLGVGLASFSLFATWFGAETVIGSAGAVAGQGLSGGRTDPFGYALCLMLMASLLAAQMRARNYVTLGDFFRERFGTAAEKLAAVAMIPTSLIWAAAQILAFASILTAVTSLALDASLIITVVIVVVYSTLGGMLGDVITDCLQGSIVIIGLAVLLYLVIDQAGGISTALGAVDPSRLTILNREEGIFEQLDGWMIPILGSLVAQEAMSRLLATRSAAVAKRACYVAAVIYLTIGCMPVMIALFGYQMIDVTDNQDSFLPALAMQVMPPVLYILFLGALISAILSTIDSALLSATALASHNLLLPQYPDINEKQKLIITRSFVVLCGIFSYLVAANGESIFELVELASYFGSSGILVCVLTGLSAKAGGQLAALATLVTGIILTSLGEFVIEVPAPYLSAVAGCIAVYWLTSLYEIKVRA